MDLKRSLLTGMLLVVAQVFMLAQPEGYYSSAEGKTEEQLRQALHDIIDDHSEKSYDYLWTAFRTTDDKADGKVWDMYSDNPDGAEFYEYTFGTDQCGNVSASEGFCYNREHSFPKSWFGGKVAPMNSDLFHLYPTDGQVNGRRSNHPFGETDSPTWTSLNGSKVGPCSVAGYGGTIFEPIDEYKGDFARTYFYMATRYFGEDSQWPGSEMIDGSQLKPWAEAMMLQWHKDDPVSTKEVERNDAVYAIQNNRNPFIDHPEYVELLYIGEVGPQPECNNDIVSMTGGSSYSYLVLYNDNIPGSGTLSIYKQPTNGTAEVKPGNVLSYIPNPGFNQQYDTIGYKVCLDSDPLACDSALMIVYVDKALGFESNVSDSRVIIYPNPNQGDFYLKYSGNPSDIQLLTLHDMSGRQLPVEYNQTSDGIRIDTSVKPGVYHLNLFLSNGERMRAAVLVQ